LAEGQGGCPECVGWSGGAGGRRTFINNPNTGLTKKTTDEHRCKKYGKKENDKCSRDSRGRGGGNSRIDLGGKRKN